MNVAIHLKNLGLDVAMISKVGRDTLGEELKRFLTSKRCAGEWIQTDEIHPTGVVVADVITPGDIAYSIVSPAAWDFIEITDQIIETAANAYAIVYGTLACRNSCSRETLNSILINTNALKIFDVNFRAPHFSKELAIHLLEKSGIVKMNQTELELTSKWLGVKAGSLEKKAQEIRKRFQLKMVFLTKGEDGAVLVSESGIWMSPGYKVAVIDTIGSGDAFLAGIIKKMIEHSPPQQMLEYSCALGALVAQHHGANPVISEKDVFDLIENQNSTTPNIRKDSPAG